jgi:hypothetical protein
MIEWWWLLVAIPLTLAAGAGLYALAMMWAFLAGGWRR